MNPTLNAKNRVALPKVIRDSLGVSPGDRVSFEPLPDGHSTIAAASPKRKCIEPIAALRGSATRNVTTDAVMRMTRGEDWNKP